MTDPNDLDEPSEPSEPNADEPAGDRTRMLTWLERALFLVAFLCLGSYAYVTLHARAVQTAAARRFDARLAARPPALPGDAGDPRASAAAPAAAPERLAIGEVVGRLEIERVGISVMVLEGDDDETLGQAAGHIPDTDLPGRADANVGIAGHRDTFFRPLKDLKVGDEIRLTTATAGSYRYTVDSVRIVSPDRIDVLDRGDHPVLTLVTCYPFYFVGHAPQRFIVRASLASPPDSAAAPAR